MREPVALLLLIAACGPDLPSRSPPPEPGPDGDLTVVSSVDFGRVPAGDRVFAGIEIANPSPHTWTIRPLPIDSAQLQLTSTTTFELLPETVSLRMVSFLPDRFAVFTAEALFAASIGNETPKMLRTNISGKGIARTSCGSCDAVIEPICADDATALRSIKTGTCAASLCSYTHYAYPCDDCVPRLIVEAPRRAETSTLVALRVSVVSCEDLPVSGALVETDSNRITPKLARANLQGTITATATIRPTAGRDHFRFHLFGWPDDVSVETDIDAFER